MIVTPLAPPDITHTTVTVKAERSQRRVVTGGVFSINQSDLLINLYVWQWISVSLEFVIYFTLKKKKKKIEWIIVPQPIMDFRNS